MIGAPSSPHERPSTRSIAWTRLGLFAVMASGLGDAVTAAAIAWDGTLLPLAIVDAAMIARTEDPP